MTKPAPVRSCATPGTGLEEQARSCLSGEAVAQPAVQMHGPREGHCRGGTQGEVHDLGAASRSSHDRPTCGKTENCLLQFLWIVFVISCTGFWSRNWILLIRGNKWNNRVHLSSRFNRGSILWMLDLGTQNQYMLYNVLGWYFIAYPAAQVWYVPRLSGGLRN